MEEISNFLFSWKKTSGGALANALTSPTLNKLLLSLLHFHQPLRILIKAAIETNEKNMASVPVASICKAA